MKFVKTLMNFASLQVKMAFSILKTHIAFKAGRVY